MENLEAKLKELLESMEEGYVYDISIIKRPCISPKEAEEKEVDRVADTNWYKVLSSSGIEGFTNTIKFLDKAELIRLAKKVGISKVNKKDGKAELIKKVIDKMNSTLEIGNVFRKN